MHRSIQILDNYDLIIVRGAPAVGKSSLGKRIKKEFEQGFVVEVDEVRAMINSDKWVHKDEHIIALNATEALVKSYLESGYKPGIVIDTFNPAKLKFFLEKFTQHKIIIVSLWAQSETLENRLLNREKGYKDWDMTRLYNDEVGKYRHDKEYFLDTSKLSKNEVLQEFMTIIGTSGHFDPVENNPK